MYNLNYIDGLITKEKYGNNFVRFLKWLNFIVHLGIIAIIVMTVFTYFDIENYNMKIENTKREIENKRTENKITDIEKEWEMVYYKLLAIRLQLDKHTNYAYIFRDLGSYMPVENEILNLTFEKNLGTVFMTISQNTLSKLTSFYDYTPTINSSFEKSSYLGHEVTIQDLEERKMDKRMVLKTLKVSVPVRSRKFVMKRDDSNNGEGSANNEQ